MGYQTPTTQRHLEMLYEGNLYGAYQPDHVILDLGKHGLMTATRDVLPF